MIEAIIGITIVALVFLAIHFKKSKIKKASSAAVRATTVHFIMPNGNIEAWNKVCNALDVIIKKHPWRTKTLAKLIKDCLEINDDYGDSFRINPYLVIRKKFGPEVEKNIKEALEAFKKASFLGFEKKLNFFDNPEAKENIKSLKNYQTLTKDEIEQKTSWFGMQKLSSEEWYFLSRLTPCLELKNLCNLKLADKGEENYFSLMSDEYE